MPRFVLSASLLFSIATKVALGFAPADADIGAMWLRFKQDFSRGYASEANDVHRLAVFKANVLRAFTLNAEQGINCTSLFDDESCVFGITKFSDRSEQEFAAIASGFRRGNRTLVRGEIVDSSELPSHSHNTVDWRAKGAVTAVKDQGQCGSCWAFSAVEAVESAAFMSSGKLMALSTQQLISCDKDDGGCDGGDTLNAYHYLKHAGGLDTSADYPDKSHRSGETLKCHWNRKHAVRVSGFKYATKPCDRGSCSHRHKQEMQMAKVLAAKGPVSVCVNAGGSGWQHYKRGIFSKRCSAANKKIDHCVQVVGFDMSGKHPYWIVRNSWNEDWGIKGYMHLAMGRNLCGITDEATIAHVSMSEDTSVLTV